MRIRATFFIVFMSPVFLLSAQDSVSNNIVETRKFRYGIFESFNDFKTNTPTITSGFIIQYDSGKYVRATLRYDKGTKIRRVYAFSDGVNLWVNARIYLEVNYFIPVLEIGPAIYFEDFLGRVDAEAKVFGLGMRGYAIGRIIGNVIATDNPGWLIYLPDDEGYAYTLDKKTVSSIFENDDRELFERFKADKRPKNNAILKEYIKEFNQRNFKLNASSRH
jgi:hypothetical protein